MVDSPSWMTWARARPSAAPAPARAVHVTAVDILMFTAAVLTVLIYSQCWLMALQGDNPKPGESSLVRAMFFPAYGCTLLILLAGPSDVLKAWLRQPLLILVLWVVAASWLWSINPDQTLRRAIALILTTLSGVVLAARWRWKGLAEVIATAHALLAVASLVAALAFPAFGVMHKDFPGAWRGLWIEKNDLGNMMTTGFCACAAAALLAPRRAKLWWPAAGLCLVLVLGSTSKTSLVACALGACGLLLTAVLRRGPVGRVVGTYGAVVSIVLAAGVGLVASNVLLAALGKDATLTGRTQIWAAVMRRIQEHPWLGYGYGAVWDDTSPWGPHAWIVKQAGFTPAHSHNSWLEQWLGLGVPGLAAWALYFLETCTRGIVSLYRTPGAYLAVPFLLVYAMTSMTESIAVIFNDSRWLLFVALGVRLALPEEPAVRTPRRPGPSPGPRRS
jgi:O-antigen ligase